MDEAMLKVGDDAVHGETAYAIGSEGEWSDAPELKPSIKSRA
jgi:hypothetical protein